MLSVASVVNSRPTTVACISHSKSSFVYYTIDSMQSASRLISLLYTYGRRYWEFVRFMGTGFRRSPCSCPLATCSAVSWYKSCRRSSASAAPFRSSLSGNLSPVVSDNTSKKSTTEKQTWRHKFTIHLVDHMTCSTDIQCCPQKVDVYCRLGRSVPSMSLSVCL